MHGDAVQQRVLPETGQNGPPTPLSPDLAGREVKSQGLPALHPQQLLRRHVGQRFQPGAGLRCQRSTCEPNASARSSTGSPALEQISARATDQQASRPLLAKLVQEGRVVRHYLSAMRTCAKALSDLRPAPPRSGDMPGAAASATRSLGNPNDSWARPAAEASVSAKAPWPAPPSKRPASTPLTRAAFPSDHSSLHAPAARQL